MTTQEQRFPKFPKERPPLPDEIAKIYADQYKSNREGDSTAASLAQRMESWLHKQVAKDVSNETSSKSTLELGAGTLNQLKHEPVSDQYDIVEPFESLFNDSPLLSRIRSTYTDINDIEEDKKYDRITSIAVLEHVTHLPNLVGKSGLLMNNGAVFKASIPSEGTFLWTLGWKLTTGMEFKMKYGLDYGLLMKHEHVNTAKEIEEVLRYFFKDVSFKVFGLSRSVSLYQYFECRNPDLDKCRAFAS